MYELKFYFVILYSSLLFLTPHPRLPHKIFQIRLDLGMKSLQECIDILQSEVTEISENIASKVPDTATAAPSLMDKTTETNVRKFILSVLLVLARQCIYYHSQQFNLVTFIQAFLYI